MKEQLLKPVASYDLLMISAAVQPLQFSSLALAMAFLRGFGCLRQEENYSRGLMIVSRTSCDDDDGGNSGDTPPATSLFTSNPFFSFFSSCSNPEEEMDIFLLDGMDHIVSASRK